MEFDERVRGQLFQHILFPLRTSYFQDLDRVLLAAVVTHAGDLSIGETVRAASSFGKDVVYLRSVGAAAVRLFPEGATRAAPRGHEPGWNDNGNHRTDRGWSFVQARIAELGASPSAPTLALSDLVRRWHSSPARHAIEDSYQ